MTIGNYIIDNYAVIGASSAGLVTLFISRSKTPNPRHFGLQIFLSIWNLILIKTIYFDELFDRWNLINSEFELSVMGGGWVAFAVLSGREWGTGAGATEKPGWKQTREQFVICFENSKWNRFCAFRLPICEDVAAQDEGMNNKDYVNFVFLKKQGINHFNGLFL